MNTAFHGCGNFSESKIENIALINSCNVPEMMYSTVKSLSFSVALQAKKI